MYVLLRIKTKQKQETAMESDGIIGIEMLPKYTLPLGCFKEARCIDLRNDLQAAECRSM